ncbi:hypothetical protein [Novipirellula maiorica]|nr:hypothetical protein [Rhodopirellula maiorica]
MRSFDQERDESDTGHEKPYWADGVPSVTVAKRETDDPACEGQ